MTCAATIATASGITGFTLPGMMLLPGCSAGSAISPKPASGPLFIQRRSFAIFIRLTASVFELTGQLDRRVLRAQRLEVIVAAECERRPVVRCESSAANARPKFGCALMPVPTAVPPCAQARAGAAARRLMRCDAALDLRAPAAELLAERHRHRIHQVRAAGLDDAAPTSRALLLERLAQMLERRQQVVHARRARR